MFLLKGHRGRVHSLVFSPDGAALASAAGRERSVSLWRPAGGTRRRLLAGPEWPVASLAFTPDGRQLLAGQNVGYLRTWDTTTWTGRAGPVGIWGTFRALAF